MKSVVTPEQVIELAFVPDGMVTRSKITLMDIALAESRYLLPLIGEALYDALLAGRYEMLCEEYVVPMVAAWTRYVAEPLMVERIGRGYDDNYTQADNDAREEVILSLRRNAAGFSQRLTDYLNEHCDEFVEYNPADNPLNHCILYGGIVQIF
jgi:hypothetical protein